MPTPNYVYKEFYTYSIPVIASLASGVSATPSMQIQNDADFEVQKLVYYCDENASTTASTRIYPQLSLLIQDGGSGSQLMNTAIPFGMLLGNGELPFILPQTRLFKANSQISLAIANFSAATTYYNIYVGFVGRKLFRG